MEGERESRFSMESTWVEGGGERQIKIISVCMPLCVCTLVEERDEKYMCSDQAEF